MPVLALFLAFSLVIDAAENPKDCGKIPKAKGNLNGQNRYAFLMSSLLQILSSGRDGESLYCSQYRYSTELLIMIGRTP